MFFRTSLATHLSLCLGVFLALFAPPASAHSFSYAAVKTQLSITDTQGQLTTVIPQSIGVTPSEGQTPEELLSLYFNQFLIFKVNDQACHIAVTSFDHTSVQDQTTYQGVLTCPLPVTSLDSLSIHSEIFADTFETTDHFLDVSLGGQTYSLIFTSEKRDFPQQISAASHTGQPATASATTSDSTATEPPVATTDQPLFSQSLVDIAREFFQFGLWHIWTGYDHILFLLSAILLIRHWKQLLKVVSSFTIAHSLTLAIAALGLVTLPSRIVEPIIALSIIYTAGHNLWLLYRYPDGQASHSADHQLEHHSSHQPGKNNFSESKSQWLTTFGFGLLHGLGFASILTDQKLPALYFLPSLVVFNLGIEVGQLVILLFVIPLFLVLDRLAYRRVIFIFLSIIITGLASFWFYQRVFATSSL